MRGGDKLRTTWRELHNRHGREEAKRDAAGFERTLSSRSHDKWDLHSPLLLLPPRLLRQLSVGIKTHGLANSAHLSVGTGGFE